MMAIRGATTPRWEVDAMTATSQAAAPPDDAFFERHTRDFSLRDGSRIRVRPVRPEDKRALVEGLARLSPASRYRRFLSPVGDLPERTLRYLTEIDYDRHFAWAAFSLDEPGTPGIAVARYVCDPDDPTIAEPAVAVIDEYQHRGLGILMLHILTSTAADHGVRAFRASILADNEPMRAIFKDMGARLRADGPGVLRAEVDLPGRERARAQLLYDGLRYACEGAIARARRVLRGD